MTTASQDYIDISEARFTGDPINSNSYENIDDTQKSFVKNCKILKQYLENKSEDVKHNTAENSSSLIESDCNKKKYLSDYKHSRSSQISRFFILIFNMFNSDINSIVDLCLIPFGKYQQKINKKLVKYLLLLAIFIVALVKSRKDEVHQSFETKQFFSRHSLVTDFFHGELSLLRDEILASELTVVMYYAPWDRQSQAFVPHFLKAAQYHHEQVTFAAINCWLPMSECKAHYNLLSYPVIVLHIKISVAEESFTVPYNGPLSSHHLIRFISKALRPLTLIASQSDLLEVQIMNQVIVLGHYDVGNISEDFLSFYLAAVSKLQYEHMSDAKYALITNSALAKRVSFTKRPNIHLITWNTTLVYPSAVDRNWRNITHFVNIHFTEVVQWLHMNGRKSRALNSVYQNGPFVVVFTPENPHHATNDAFQLARSVALEYFNCNHSPLRLWLTENFLVKTRSQLRDSDKICRQYLKQHLDNESTILSSLETDEKLFEEVDTCGTERIPSACKFQEQGSVSYIIWNSLWSSFIETGPAFFGTRCFKSTSSASCKSGNRSSIGTQDAFAYWKSDVDYEPVKSGPIEDDRVQKMGDWVSEDHCKKLFLGSIVAPPPVLVEDQGKVRITGLSCSTNRTLSFIAVDSLLHEDFANQLGLNLSATKPKLSGSVIVDPDYEERYVLEQPLSRNSLASFVYNFTKSALQRSKIVSNDEKLGSPCRHGEVCMLELNANNYVEVTSRPRQAYVVMHYTHQCGACSAISNTLLTCLHLTTGVSNLTFARIDVSRNTLPWHLTFQSVPIIIFYPHDKHSDSRVFDSTLSVTVKNVMSFIVSGLKPPERNALATKLCDLDCKKSVASQSLVLRLKLHHVLSVVTSKIRRYIYLLVQLKNQLLIDQLNYNNLRSKYSLIVDLKNKLTLDLIRLKAKMNHISQVENLYPTVPLDYSNQFSYETDTLLYDKYVKTEL